MKRSSRLRFLFSSLRPSPHFIQEKPVSASSSCLTAPSIRNTHFSCCKNAKMAPHLDKVPTDVINAFGGLSSKSLFLSGSNSTRFQVLSLKQNVCVKICSEKKFYLFKTHLCVCLFKGTYFIKHVCITYKNKSSNATDFIRVLLEQIRSYFKRKTRPFFTKN